MSRAQYTEAEYLSFKEEWDSVTHWLIGHVKGLDRVVIVPDRNGSGQLITERGVRLNGLISEKYPAVADFCSDMGLSSTCFYDKLYEKYAWSANEAVKACRLLGIETNEENIKCFFNVKQEA